MSRHNKVNRDRYTIAGRLTADDLARERRKQGVECPTRANAASARRPTVQYAALSAAGQPPKTSRRAAHKKPGAD